MDAGLLAYYNSELSYLRELGAEFAALYPKIAGRLRLEATECADPHVERLLEGVAFLTARVRRKIDDEFPEITEALLNLLYPHYLRPLPSMSIVQFVAGPDAAKLSEGHTVAAETMLESPPVRGYSCRFRTAYPTTLWPVEVTDVRLLQDRILVPGKPPDATSLLQLSLRWTGEPAPAPWKADQLRFYLDGDQPNVHALYELIFNRVCKILVRGLRDNGTPETVELPLHAIRPVGFGIHEGMIPYPSRSFPGYRLLQEYFAFPEKFLFFDLAELGRLKGRPLGNSIEVLIFLNSSRLDEVKAGPDNFRLHCTPIVNLFTLITEPILLDQTRYEYRVVPDVHQPLATEIYSIDEVTSVASYLSEPLRFEPFYDMRTRVDGPAARSYWAISRRPSQRSNDPGTEVFLSFFDPGFRPTHPAAEVLTVRATCTNRDLPSRLPFGGDLGDFALEAPGPISRVRCLRKPLPARWPPQGRHTHWPLISHLALNHLSLNDSEAGLESLREILRLYDWADSAATRQQIHGITSISSQRVAGRSGRSVGNAVCLGMEVTIEFDETHFVGSGAFLMASVLEHFLGLYASINSFSQLVAKTRQREGTLKRWPPRAGYRTLL